MLKKAMLWWNEKQELKQYNKGYAWAERELLAGRESAQAVQLFIDNGNCTQFEKGAIRAMYSLIANGKIEDNVIP